MAHRYVNRNIGIRVIRSDNSVDKFNPEEIIVSCMNAGVSSSIATSIALDIAKNVYDGITTREIREMVYSSLRRINPELAERYKYRARLRVRTSRTTLETFDRKHIVNSLVKETGIDRKLAEKIARDVGRELERMRLNYVTAPLIREIVNVKLLERGLERERAKYTRLGMPVYDVKDLIEKPHKENANLQYNPETVHKLMADQISKEYALINVLPIELADSHMRGEIHIHDLDYFATRPFCFSHDIRFFLKNGFKADGVGNHTAIAGPAKRPEVAFLHAAKVLAASQTNCSGGQGFSYFNTFLAPYVRGLSERKINQLAQMFIYEMSQMYVARGGQTVFSSIDCDMSIPEQFRDVPAVLPGGKVRDRITYSDFEDEARKLFNALVDVYLHGDYIGKPFNFPKFEVQIYPKELKNGENEEELMKVSRLAAKFGTPYYIINQPYMPKFACYQCCSFLMPLTEANTDDDLYNGTIRGGGLQVVTINLPQIAYESNGNDDKLFELLEERMKKARDILLLKREIIKRNLRNDLLPFMSQRIDDNGTLYLEPDRQSYIIGLVGMNEMLAAHLGLELHESDYAWKFGLKVMKRMKDIVARFREETGLNFSLARTPAESCAYRLAQIDLNRYDGKAVVNGSGDSAYYTNSFHVRPSADVPLWKRLKIEGSFHPLTDGGAMSHVWLGEQNPSPEGIYELTRKISLKTAIQYFAFTKDLSVCRDCSFVTGGFVDRCPNCNSSRIDYWSRITGYYQNISGWNKGKIAELRDRARYGTQGNVIALKSKQ
ncbi:MAG: anaerobic ribonucleoside-triphosphate reductase [Candidatus Altiarchaeales archaeon]|nr:MAG: anaerobic ribonucleoside-triphosphate reductase [Candidatus Altiarchaeales archaeon]